MNQQTVVSLLSLAACLADTALGSQAAVTSNIIASIRKDTINTFTTTDADFITKPIVDLSAEDSRRYINDEDGFRTKVNPGQRVRLNLADDFREYMVDADFRSTVNALVDNPLEQIWSDMQELVLDLSFSQVKDINHLAGLKNLEYLDLCHSEVEDISPLAGLKNLQWLFLYDTQVKDISKLAGLKNLQWLFLYDSQVQDISPVAGMKNLHFLYLSGTLVTDVTPLAGLGNLKQLYLSSAKPIDVSALRGLENLNITIVTKEI